MIPLHAPYGFVPLNDVTFLPDWADRVSQDEPLADGLYGTLDLEIEAETDLFVRGAKDPERFFSGPDGIPALPGSSLRGALRSVVEIASFGWMRRVNDHRFGVRDLQNRTLYLDHMAGLLPGPNGENVPMPKVVAGWLERIARDDADHEHDADVVAHIEPCDFAKIHYRTLEALLQEPGLAAEFGHQQSAPEKYRRLGVLHPLDGPTLPDRSGLAVRVGVLHLRKPAPEWLDRRFGVADGPGRHAGTLVMTGQPSTWDPRRPQGAGGHPKQHDFVFFDVPGAKPLQVTRAAFRDFEFVHGKGQEKHSVNQRIDPNVEWGFWRPFFDAGERVPVFFLVEDDGSLRAFGLAMMFRLTYRHTVGELVRAGQPGQGGDEGARPDLAELLFGHVPLGRSTEGAEEARKGRVSVGLGRLVAGGSEQEARTILLGAPKASFYPAYIEQSDDGPGRDAPSKDRYRTYMDDAGGVPSSRIRGHKRYRIQPSVMPGPPLPRRSNGTVNVGVGTTFSPLGAGTRFRARIRVHNVSRAELGALLWAVDFGSSTEARHAVGMARSLGYGRCRLTVVAHDLRWNDLDRAPDPAVLDGARRDYEQMMEGFCRTAGVEGGWRHGRRLQELVELAKPVPEDSPHREHLRLKAQGEGHRTVNEFVEAKKQGAALPPALSDAEWVDRARRAGVSLRQNQPAGSREPRPPEPGRKPVVIAHSPRGGQPAPTRSPMAPPRTGEWEGLKGGTLVRVELLGLTRKGKWRGRLVGEHAVPGVDARGVLGAGQPPTDAAEGMVVSAVVTAGGDHTNLGLKWL